MHLLSDRSLILLRGLPGSGKSTVAKVLCEDGKYPVFAIDDYFMDPADGTYHFEFDKNHLAYKNCEELTTKALEAGVSKVFVDNTFTLEWELEPYFKMAARYKYTLFVLTVENYHGRENIHDVSREQLERMAAKYKVKLY
jgi:predicted kinase